MFDPITLPIARSLFPLIAALILTSNSGAEVPKATTVKPIKPWLMFSFTAMAVAPSTSSFPPVKRRTRPRPNRKKTSTVLKFLSKC